MSDTATIHHYRAAIRDFEAGKISVEHRIGRLCTSGDAVLQTLRPLSDAEIRSWIAACAGEDWCAPDAREYDDLVIAVDGREIA
jgi:hypothetical protein